MHSVIECALGTYCPEGHLSQDDENACREKCPAEQFLQIVAPAVEYKPGRHPAHVEFDVAARAPPPPENMPAVHWVQADVPLAAAYLPDSHGAQTSADVAAGVAEKKPGWQAVQTEVVTLSAKKPAGHGEQEVAPGKEKYPTLHSTQVLAAASPRDRDILPAGQSRHSLLPGGAYVPSPHSVHKVAASFAVN